MIKENLIPLQDYYPAVATAMVQDSEFKTLIGRVVVAVRSGNCQETLDPLKNLRAYAQSKWGVGGEKWQHLNTMSLACERAINNYKQENPIQ